jgi:two-component system, NtrC family, response regulator AtoC
MGDQKTRIMAVDDEPDILEVVKLLLARLNVWTDTFTSPFDALEKIRKEPYDVVLTDIRMPLLNGIELSREIKKVRPETHVLFMSAFETPLTMAYANAKESDIISKPFTAGQLVKFLSPRISELRV